MVYPVNTTHSRGATDIRLNIASYLAEQVPLLLDRARIAWGVSEDKLPVPVTFTPYEPTGLDTYPMIGVSINRSGNYIRNDLDGAGTPQYRSNWSVNVFLWVRTPMNADGTWAQPEYTEAIRARDDLSAVVKFALLRDVSLGSPRMELQEGTLSESYSDATKVGGDRWIAACTWNFDLSLDEGGVADNLGIYDPAVVDVL